MGEIIQITFPKKEDPLVRDFWDPNMITNYWEADIPTINKTRDEIGKVLGLNFVSRLIKIAKNKNTILGKQWQKTKKFPIYITYHIKQMNLEEVQTAINILNKEIKKNKTSMKIELLAIRNYLINIQK